jgi:hypothetical protein
MTETETTNGHHPKTDPAPPPQQRTLFVEIRSSEGTAEVWEPDEELMRELGWVRELQPGESLAYGRASIPKAEPPPTVSLQSFGHVGSHRFEFGTGLRVEQQLAAKPEGDGYIPAREWLQRRGGILVMRGAEEAPKLEELLLDMLELSNVRVREDLLIGTLPREQR